MIMTYNRIIGQITQGLTGDAAADMQYLKAQMEKYKNHKMSQEILRACGRMMYELIPADRKEELGKVIDNELKGVEATLDEIRFNIYKNNLATAMKLSEALVESVERNPMFKSDEVSEYFSFYEFFEELMYEFYNNPEKTIRQVELPFAEIYFQHGSLLFEQKRYVEARNILSKARRWNPVNAKIAFEYMETYKVLGEIEQFAELTKETFQYAFKAADLARCYRNLGYYFVEKELYKEAAGCYLMSLQYDSENKTAQSELYYIQTKAPRGFKEPTLDELQEYGVKYGFPIGASDDVLGLAFSYGKHFAQDGQTEGAIYCLKIAYELTNDQGINELIEKLMNKDET
ncbi:MAG: tetratricopeptide repeat protein [Ruminococcaceae bacterium]|nr:tetratricopeptide repeat protein [Oscillospiraceae bacterium]